MSYVNCTADVKALSDACCTSANAAKIVERIDSEQYPVRARSEPRELRAGADAASAIISWDGNCYVHHQITPDEVNKVKRAIPGIKVIAHPECRARRAGARRRGAVDQRDGALCEESDADKFLIVTECGLSDRLLMEIPDKHFYKACKLCRFMKMITLEGTLDSLRHLRYEIELTEDVREGAKRALERMLELSV